MKLRNRLVAMAVVVSGALAVITTPPATADSDTQPTATVNGKQLDGSTLPGSFVVDFAGPDELTGVHFWLDGDILGEDKEAPYFWPVITGEGKHRFKVFANDHIGEMRQQLEVDFVVTGADPVAEKTYEAITAVPDVIAETVPGTAKLTGDSLSDGVTLTAPGITTLTAPDGGAATTVPSGDPLTLSVAMPAATEPLANQGSAAAEPGDFGTTGLAASTTDLPSTSVAVQSLADGLRLMTVARDANAPAKTSFDLTLPEGATLRTTTDSETDDTTGAGIAVVRNGAVIGEVTAPWAHDATGRKLPTSYTVEGNRVTQVVDYTGAVFPVVADPRLSFGWNVYVTWNRSEVWNYRNKVSYVQGLLSVCAAIPHAAAKVICGGLGYVKMTQLRNVWGYAAGNNRCVQFVIPYWTLNNPLNTAWYTQIKHINC
ncbi:hypothetical protein [Streptosporangium sp. NPDC000396]|uniref:hypothetical protein n=1 Tax=Streptosporangium sp. NPDC000396 TaxID=3366185 RepID=UPI0036CAA07B